MALVAGGGYAEYCAAPAPQCLPIPRGLSVEEAAAMPETFFTVWTNVFERGRLQRGETHARPRRRERHRHDGDPDVERAFGARVFATAGSPDKCAACERLGAERAINYRTEDFVEVVKDLTGGRGVDVILDMVGGDYVARNLEALAMDGRLVQIAFLRGAQAEINLNPLMRKRHHVHGIDAAATHAWRRRAPSRGRSRSTCGRWSSRARCARSFTRPSRCAMRRWRMPRSRRASTSGRSS